MPAFPTEQVAVTGFGCVTALGGNAPKTWEALVQGHSARAPLTAIAVQGCRVTEGAQAELPPLKGMTEKALARLSRASRLAQPAVAEALAHAGLLGPSGHCTLPRLEMSISTTACGMEKGEEFLHGIWAQSSSGQSARVAHYQAQQQTAQIQRHFGFTGPVMIVANACAGGGNAIGHASDLIRAGMADIVLAGGYDALSELVYCGFDCLQSLAPQACRPFDRGRQGLMLGEGAGFLVLESISHAHKRGATVHAHVAGYGHTTDVHHLTQPAPDGAPLERAIRQALAKGGREAADVGYVNAHGTGTPFNDGAEAQAFHRVFGRSTTKLSSTKAALGHTLGGAGAIEGILTVLALQTGQLPPQINLEDPEPLVSKHLAASNQTIQIETALSVNLGFGGSNAAVLFTRG